MAFGDYFKDLLELVSMGGYRAGPAVPAGRTPTPIGREPTSAKLEEAVEAELAAVRGEVGAQLAQALHRSDVGFAQLGRFRSGRAGAARRELETGAMQAIARETGRTKLEQFGLAEQATQALRQYQLQKAGLQAQQSAANTQMLSGLFQAAAPFLMSAIFPAAAPAAGMSTSDLFLLQMLMGQRGGLTPQQQLPGQADNLTTTWEQLRR